MSEGQMSVLVIDDDDVAVQAVVRSLEKQQIDLPVVSAADGAEALRLLRGEDSSRSICSPLMILLDLNMAGMSGIEFLESMRSDPKLHHNVVFVWTTSDSHNDREAAYARHVAGYMVKSSNDRRHAYLAGLLQLYREHIKLRH